MIYCDDYSLNVTTCFGVSLVHVKVWLNEHGYIVWGSECTRDFKESLSCMDLFCQYRLMVSLLLYSAGLQEEHFQLVWAANQEAAALATSCWTRRRRWQTRGCCQIGIRYERFCTCLYIPASSRFHCSHCFWFRTHIIWQPNTVLL